MNLEEKKAEGLELFKEGHSLSSISREIGINRLTITNYVKKQGYEVTNPSKKYRYDSDFFETIDTENKSYWLGFLFADGTVNERKKSKTLELSLMYADKAHLEKFISDIKAESNPIKTKEVNLKGKTYLSCRVTISSTKICDDLISHGCTPRKSLKLNFPESVPENLIPHFIRGYIDGDGCIQDLGKRQRLNVTGNYEFLLSIQEYFEKLGSSKTKIARYGDRKAYQFEKSGDELIPVLHFLYSNATVFLDRKYDLYLAVSERNLRRKKSEIKRGNPPSKRKDNPNRRLRVKPESGAEHRK